MPKYSLKAFIVILTLGLTSILKDAYAQEKLPVDYVRMENLTIENGLSQNFVPCIIQDGEGYIWFATKDGLNKYDGYNFTIYRHDPDDTTSIADNSINYIFEDSRSRLWVGTVSGGLDLFDREKEIFIHFAPKAERFKSANHLSNIQRIAEDPGGGIWLLTQNQWDKVERLSGPTNRSGFYPANKFVEDSLHIQLGNQAFSLRSTTGGIFGIMTHDSLYIADKKAWLGHEPIRMSLQKMLKAAGQESNSNPHYKHNSIFVTDAVHKKNYLVSTDGSVYELDYHNAKARLLWESKPDAELGILHCLSDYYGRIWLFSFNKFYCFDPGKGIMKLIKNSNNPMDSIFRSSTISGSAFIDKGGVVWAGTTGIIKFNINSHKFIHCKSEKFTNTSINYFSTDREGNVYVGIAEQKRVYIFDKKEKKITGAFIPPEVISSLNRQLNDYEKLNGKEAGKRVLHTTDNFEADIPIQDKDGYYWFNIGNGYLAKYDKNNKKIWFSDLKTYGEQIQPTNLFIDKDNRLWFGNSHIMGRNELYCFDTKSRKIIRQYKFPYKGQYQDYRYISCIVQDEDGIFWLATMEGLFKLDEKKNLWTYYRNQPENKSSLSGNMLFSICADPKNKRYLWIGTNGSGLNRFDKSTTSFKRYGLKQGLPNMVIYGLLPDAEQRLWLSSNKGLSCLIPAKDSFINYTQEDGLQSNEFNRYAYARLPSGELIFGGINGLNFFNPSDIKRSMHPPDVVFTDFKLMNHLVSFKEKGSPLKHVLRNNDLIILPWYRNILSFEFAALDFDAPQKNRYRYKLTGLDKEWVEGGTKREASYTNLAPGNYTFYVTACNSDGIWSNKPASLNIIITPPWWETWWAKMLYACILLSGIALFIRIRTRTLKMRNLELEAKVEERTHDLNIAMHRLEKLNTVKDKLFSIISHDLRSPLAALKESLNLLRTGSIKQEKISYYFEKIDASVQVTLNLLDNLLHWSLSQMQGQELSPSEINLKAIADENISLYQNIASQKQVQIVNEIEEDCKVWADPNITRLVVRNLLNNALKFSPIGAQVHLHGFHANGSAGMSIKDQGAGIAKEQLSLLFDLNKNKKPAMGTANEKGTGLGLALCKELIEKSGGSIKVESETGKGAVFSIFLPRAE